MHTHYRAVCDTHKEACHILVNCNYHTKLNFYESHSKEICEFLTKHYGCNLRLIHNDHDLDYLFDNKYLFVDEFWDRKVV